MQPEQRNREGCSTRDVSAGTTSFVLRTEYRARNFNMNGRCFVFFFTKKKKEYREQNARLFRLSRNHAQMARTMPPTGALLHLRVSRRENGWSARNHIGDFKHDLTPAANNELQMSHGRESSYLIDRSVASHGRADVQVFL